MLVRMLHHTIQAHMRVRAHAPIHAYTRALNRDRASCFSAVWLLICWGHYWLSGQSAFRVQFCLSRPIWGRIHQSSAYCTVRPLDLQLDWFHRFHPATLHTTRYPPFCSYDMIWLRWTGPILDNCLLCCYDPSPLIRQLLYSCAALLMKQFRSIRNFCPSNKRPHPLQFWIPGIDLILPNNLRSRKL